MFHGILCCHEILLQDFHELLQLLFPWQNIGRERAVQTARQTEWDADINADRLFIRSL